MTVDFIQNSRSRYLMSEIVTVEMRFWNANNYIAMFSFLISTNTCAVCVVLMSPYTLYRGFISVSSHRCLK